MRFILNIKIWQKLMLLAVVMGGIILFLAIAFFSGKYRELQQAKIDHAAVENLSHLGSLMTQISGETNLDLETLSGEFERIFIMMEGSQAGVDSLAATQLKQVWNTSKNEGTSTRDWAALADTLARTLREYAVLSGLGEVAADNAGRLLHGALYPLAETAALAHHLRRLETQMLVNQNPASDTSVLTIFSRRVAAEGARALAEIQAVKTEGGIIESALADARNKLQESLAKLNSRPPIQPDLPVQFDGSATAIQTNAANLMITALGQAGEAAKLRHSRVRNSFWWPAGWLLFGLLLTLLVFYLVTNALTLPIDQISETFGEIGIGNFDSRVEIEGEDELYTMATNLNTLLDNTLHLVQSEDERERIQGSIMKLLQEISGVADGDLRGQAMVTAEVTGAIADSFNFMLQQLREVIGNVVDTTLQVSSTANEIQATAENLSDGTEAQSHQILNTSAAIEEMAVSIQQVSENATMSASVAEQALANAKQGSLSVEKTIDGMNNIRRGVQETSKRIKRLGESSQQIGDFVQLIGGIADRTSILALNASIQAAMAGDAGRGFAVVAEQVERLAERSAEATKQIAGIINTIQTETNDAVQAMEDTTQEVVQGSQLSRESGQALEEIRTVSQKLATLIQSISTAAQQQARGSESLAKSMNEISQITQQSSSGTRQAALAINTLADMADNLRGSVSQFKLPKA